ncbi:hypothetical protein BDV10DRAFT_138832 [Aspergillus recurvatus]
MPLSSCPINRVVCLDLCYTILTVRIFSNIAFSASWNGLSRMLLSNSLSYWSPMSIWSKHALRTYGRFARFELESKSWYTFWLGIPQGCAFPFTNPKCHLVCDPVRISLIKRAWNRKTLLTAKAKLSSPIDSTDSRWCCRFFNGLGHPITRLCVTIQVRIF